MTIPDEVVDCLEGYINRYAPNRIARIGPAAALRSLCADQAGPQIALTPAFDLDRNLADLGRIDLALVLDAPAILPTIVTRQLLARLRNYSARAVIAAFDGDAARRTGRWSVGEFLGLGFRRVPEARNLDSGYWIYRYDIHDYKITPDWLNARNWANPEQWGRRRW